VPWPALCPASAAHMCPAAAWHIHEAEATSLFFGSHSVTITPVQHQKKGRLAGSQAGRRASACPAPSEAQRYAGSSTYTERVPEGLEAFQGHQQGHLPTPQPHLPPLRAPTFDHTGGVQQLGLPDGQARALRVMQRVLEPHWPPAVHREWVLHVQQGSRPSLWQQQQQQHWQHPGAGRHAVPAPRGMQASALPSRMYVSQAQGEMRLATLLVKEE